MISIMFGYLMIFMFILSVFGVVIFSGVMVAYYVQYRVKLTQLNNRLADPNPEQFDLQFYQDKIDIFYSRFKVFRFWTILCGVLLHLFIILMILSFGASILEFGLFSYILSYFIN